MKNIRKPKLGDYMIWGDQYKVYTDRGWVICDTYTELLEELNNIDSLLKEGGENGTSKES